MSGTNIDTAEEERGGSHAILELERAHMSLHVGWKNTADQIFARLV